MLRIDTINTVNPPIENETQVTGLSPVINLMSPEVRDKKVFEGDVNRNMCMGVDEYFLWNTGCIDSKVMLADLQGKKVRVTIEILDIEDRPSI